MIVDFMILVLGPYTCQSKAKANGSAVSYIFQCVHYVERVRLCRFTYTVDLFTHSVVHETLFISNLADCIVFVHCVIGIQIKESSSIM